MPAKGEAVDTPPESPQLFVSAWRVRLRGFGIGHLFATAHASPEGRGQWRVRTREPVDRTVFTPPITLDSEENSL